MCTKSALCKKHHFLLENRNKKLDTDQDGLCVMCTHPKKQSLKETLCVTLQVMLERMRLNYALIKSESCSSLFMVLLSFLLKLTLASNTFSWTRSLWFSWFPGCTFSNCSFWALFPTPQKNSLCQGTCTSTHLLSPSLYLQNDSKLKVMLGSSHPFPLHSQVLTESRVFSVLKALPAFCIFTPSSFGPQPFLVSLARSFCLATYPFVAFL